jgi:hypothetical protein
MRGLELKQSKRWEVFFLKKKQYKSMPLCLKIVKIFFGSFSFDTKLFSLKFYFIYIWFEEARELSNYNK